MQGKWKDFGFEVMIDPAKAINTAAGHGREDPPGPRRHLHRVARPGVRPRPEEDRRHGRGNALLVRALVRRASPGHARLLRRPPDRLLLQGRLRRVHHALVGPHERARSRTTSATRTTRSSTPGRLDFKPMKGLVVGDVGRHGGDRRRNAHRNRSAVWGAHVKYGGYDVPARSSGSSSNTSPPRHADEPHEAGAVGLLRVGALHLRRPLPGRRPVRPAQQQPARPAQQQHAVDGRRPLAPALEEREHQARVVQHRRRRAGRSTASPTAATTRSCWRPRPPSDGPPKALIKGVA